MFTITGGSGMYAGATGTGTLSDVSYGPPTFSGKDTWTGTFKVGKIRVSCTATDSSGNTATTQFTITVTPRR